MAEMPATDYRKVTRDYPSAAMPYSNSSAHVIIERMRVPGDEEHYVLGSFDRPSTVYMQQVRALNLVFALEQKHGSGAARSLVVIGGGAGGVTAAAAAAARGWNVTLLERKRDVLLLAGSASTHRLVHPNIYEWPNEGSEDPHTHLGILDWTADASRAVADQLRAEWRQLERAWAIGTHVDVTNLTMDRLANRQTLVRWNGKGVRIAETAQQAGMSVVTRKRQQVRAHVVIVAVGFGEEKSNPPHFPDISPYWDNDRIDKSREYDGPGPIVLVSGTGDGGLIDALRFCYNDFRHELALRQLQDRLGPKLYQAVKEKVYAVEEYVQNMAGSDQLRAAELNARYHDLGTEVFEQAAQNQQDRSVTVILTGQDRYPLSLRAAPINRMLFTLTNTEYRQGTVTSARKIADGEWKVQFEGAPKEETYDDVVIRHGPRPVLPLLFPEIYERIRAMRAGWSSVRQSERDPTRDPLYNDAFKAELTAKAAAARMTPSSTAVAAASLSGLVAGTDPLQEYRRLLPSFLGPVALAVADRAEAALAAFALKQHTGGDVDTQVQLLVGTAKSGKTTLLQNLAQRLVRGEIKVPIFLDLRTLRDSPSQSLFAHAIKAAVENFGTHLSAPGRLSAALLNTAMRGKLVLLMDGLDEMDEMRRRDLLSALRRSGSDLYRGNRVVLASRPLGAKLAWLPVIQLMPRDSLLHETRTLLGDLVSGARRGNLSDRLFKLLSTAALNRLCSGDTPLDFTSILMESGLDETHAVQLAPWIVRHHADVPIWEFSQPAVESALAAMALLQSGDPQALPGLVFDRRFADGPVLAAVLSLASDAVTLQAMLATLSDTLDWQVLRLRLRLAKLQPDLPPELALQLARNTASIVAEPGLATVQFVISLGDECRRLPPAFASRLAAELTSAFDQQAVPEWYRAIRFLGRADLPGTTEKLQGWLSHDELHVARSAAEALGELARENALPALISVYLSGTKRMVFRPAIDAIVRIGTDQAEEALRGILANRDLYQNTRWPAAEALGELMSEQALECLLKEAADPAEVLRQNIAEALGNYSDVRALRQLRRMANDADEGVRISVYQSLISRAEESDVGLLHAGLNDSQLVVRLNAAEGLMRLDRPGLLKALETGLAQSGAPWREHAVALFGRMLSEDAIPVLDTLSRDADRYARLGVARALPGIATAASIPALARLAQDDDDAVRSAAVDALPLQDTPEVIEALLQNLARDEPSSSTFAALRRLRGFHNASILGALRSVIRRADFMSAWVAVALGTIGEASDIDLIATAWRGAPPRYPLSEDSFAKAIARIGGVAACKTLRGFLDDEKVLWRLYAVRALGEVREAIAIPAILHAMADRDAMVSLAASDALRTSDPALLAPGLLLGLLSTGAVQSAAARFAVPYADQTMLDAVQQAGPANWINDGPCTYQDFVLDLTRMASMKLAARGIACKMEQ